MSLKSSLCASLGSFRKKFLHSGIIIDEYLRMQHPWHVDLSRINVPILQWHGEDDRIISIGSARGLAASLPNVTFRGFPGLGRFMVYKVWREFLTELLELPEPKRATRSGALPATAGPV